MKKVLILGATSAIASELARLHAEGGDSLFLVARSRSKLDLIGRDLQVRGASKVSTYVLDLDDFAEHERMIAAADEALGSIDQVVIAHGVLGNQSESQRSYLAAEAILRTNFLSVVSILTLIANRFEERRAGSIVVISSVAGDRGRQSNYIYGTSKGALNVFLQGLRNRLTRSGVQVLTVKPGFVDTPMTADIPKGPLFASAEAVAKGIHRAVHKGKDEVYLPFFWFWIMLIIRSIPERIFKRMSL